MLVAGCLPPLKERQVASLNSGRLSMVSCMPAGWADDVRPPCGGLPAAIKRRDSAQKRTCRVNMRRWVTGAGPECVVLGSCTPSMGTHCPVITRQIAAVLAPLVDILLCETLASRAEVIAAYQWHKRCARL